MADVLDELAAARARVRELEKEVKRKAGKREPRRTGTIAARGPGVWRVRLFVGRDPATGARSFVNETVKGSRQDAETRLAAMVTERAAGTLGEVARGTVGEWLDRWHEQVVTPSKRARTAHDYHRVMERYVKPYIGHVKLKKVAPADVRSMFVSLSAKGLSPRVVRMAHEVIRNAMGTAVRDGVLKNNPARSELVKDALPRMKRKAMVTVPGGLVPKFVEKARTERLGPFFVLQLFSGLRPGEALALRWSDHVGNAVRVERALVDVLVGKEGEDPFEEPKREGSRRAVVLPRVVVTFLRLHRRRQRIERLKAGDAWQAGDLIFCDEVGAPLKLRHARHFFKKFAKRVGLPPSMSLYGLRHSCASLLLERGVSPKVAQERLGHASVTLTLDTYSHVVPGLGEAAADVLEGLVG